jgi:hypothetical protein
MKIIRRLKITTLLFCFLGTSSITISQSTLKINLKTNEVDCNGSFNGSISSQISGGVAPYYLLWSNGSTKSNLQGLKSGKYILRVTDSKGNIAEKEVLINIPDPLSIESSPNNYVLYEPIGLLVDIDIKGGTTFSDSNESYKVKIDDQSTFISPLRNGLHKITVEDAKGCKLEKEIILNFYKEDNAHSVNIAQNLKK